MICAPAGFLPVHHALASSNVSLIALTIFNLLIYRPLIPPKSIYRATTNYNSYYVVYLVAIREVRWYYDKKYCGCGKCCSVCSGGCRSSCSVLGSQRKERRKQVTIHEVVFYDQRVDRWAVRGEEEMKYSHVFSWMLIVTLATGCILQPAAENLQKSTYSSVEDTLKGLEGLPMDQFLEESYNQLLLRNPEHLTELGIAGDFGLRDNQLTDISDNYVKETQKLQEGILKILHDYDVSTLSREQRVSYQVYEWFLEDMIRGREFMYYDYPVTHFVTGVQYQLLQFFTEIHPVATLQDAEDYIACLEQVDTKMEQLIEALQKRKEAGVISPKFVIQWSLYSIRGMAQGTPKYLPFYTAFQEKVENLDITTEEKQMLLQAAEKAIQEAVIPGYGKLAQYLEDLESEAPTDDGVWQFPEGEEYYSYTLRHHTTTDLTAQEIYELGLRELERIHQEMRIIFDELGYPSDESLSDLFQRVSRDSGSISGSDVAEMYQTLIEEAEQNLDPVFDIAHTADVIVVAGSEGDYYMSGSLDGSRPGAFYANVTGRELRYGMPSLAYHEAVPGHHFQISIAQELDVPFFRTDLIFTGYTEGWALYAERLAYELGWYADDPYGNLGRLQYEAFRAARLVVDTGIHTKGWTFDEAERFMEENVGYKNSDVVNVEFEISRYIAWPGQATAYMVGMLTILELRQRAMDALGDAFDIKEFHRIVLGNGSMPLSVLEEVVQDYIDESLESHMVWSRAGTYLQ
ncbi:MAG: DUF885 domain-containing protein [Theionarchaea archaeon]|nr:DUF885 domain-containing protein [Theionarchaea archaeon]